MRPTLLCCVIAWSASTVAASAQTVPRSDLSTQQMQGLYDASVHVNTQTEEERQRAIQRALGIVLTKISGDLSTASRENVLQAERDASALAESYDYQSKPSGEHGHPNAGMSLLVRFRAEQVDALVTALGLAIWPQPRPQPLVWLAIDDGSGPRLVGQTQANAASSLIERANDRGLHMDLPKGDQPERALVQAVWQGEIPPLRQASTSYGATMLLIGKLYRVGPQWFAHWQLVDGQQRLATWDSHYSDPRKTLAQGADGATAALVHRDAQVSQAPVAAVGAYPIKVTGIRNVDDYLRVAATLQSCPVVRGIRPTRVFGETLEMALDLSSGLSGLNHFLGSQSAIQPVSLPNSQAAVGPQPVAEYRLR